MQYVFNPRNNQINPVTPMTNVDPTLRDKFVSPQLYSLVAKGKVSIADVATMFAVGKSPEVLVKNHAAVRTSPQKTAPAATTAAAEAAADANEAAGEAAGDEPATADSAFDGRSLCNKKVPDLLILAKSAGIDINAPGFVPTRGNLIKVIMAKATAAEKGESPATPAESAEAPAGESPAAE